MRKQDKRIFLICRGNYEPSILPLTMILMVELWICEMRLEFDSNSLTGISWQKSICSLLRKCGFSGDSLWLLSNKLKNFQLNKKRVIIKTRKEKQKTSIKCFFVKKKQTMTFVKHTNWNFYKNTTNGYLFEWQI